MPNLKLVIANKNYSSWSMRAWVLLTQAGIPFDEIQLKFNDDATVRGIADLSPTGLVPVLWIDGEPVWDSLAICETVSELFPEKRLWPSDPVARRTARAVSSEMHAG
ncbi:MAG: glutathione S-transferase, partial [Proteobacteria bacterium]